VNFEIFLTNQNTQVYKKNLDSLLDNDSRLILPSKNLWFRAFELTPFEETKVVILGQDPYPNEADACGLAFSSNSRIPLSLRNIFKELHNDLNLDIPKSGNLEPWASRGVLLLNTILTTTLNESLAHKGYGWEIFTFEYLKLLNAMRSNLVFILWGNNAIRYAPHLDSKKHLIITSSHPSPFSARVSFFNSKPFSRCNDYLIKHGIKPIDWSL
jgi:uracil-DNA glycosylase